MANRIEDLEPKSVWSYFAELSKIPRCSKKEEAAMAWLMSVALEHGLTAKRDQAGNLLIVVPARPGCEKAPTVVIQSHVDMVCEKNSDKTHDFDTDPIQLLVDGDCVSADGTTLGADNGIGVAMGLAFLDDPDAKHGPLELLFTVDEETGLTGAFNIGEDFFTGRTMINLDAEVVGKFTIGSAGGTDTTIGFPTARESREGLSYYRLSIDGLKGGHSGADVHLGRGNSIKILARVLLAAAEADLSEAIHLGSAVGGSKRNAIPREALATVGISAGSEAKFEKAVGEISALISEQLADADPDFTVTLKLLDTKGSAAPGTDNSAMSLRFLQMVAAVPWGILGMSTALPNLVETSSNVGVLIDNENKRELTCSTRSSSSQGLAEVLASLRAIATMAGACVEHSDGYPGWQPRLGTPLLASVEQVYTDLFEKKPEFLAVHAGLECGLFLGKYPELQIIAYGADIREGHSPDEWVSIASVEKCWKFTRALVGHLSERRDGNIR
jgi:dipeptidase D